MSLVEQKDIEIRSLIATQTGFDTSLIEVDANATAPFYVVHPVATGDYTGAMGDPNSIADFMYQVDTIGVSVEQVELAEYRMMEAVNDHWNTITDVMGPPSLRRSGTVREDDQTYKSVSIIGLKVSS